MMFCSGCSAELHGHYEFRSDGAPVCIACAEEHEKQVKLALKTGSLPPIPKDVIDSLVGVPSEVLPAESTGSVAFGPASGVHEIVIAPLEEPPVTSRRWMVQRAAIAVGGAVGIGAAMIAALT